MTTIETVPPEQPLPAPDGLLLELSKYPIYESCVTDLGDPTAIGGEIDHRVTVVEQLTAAFWDGVGDDPGQHHLDEDPLVVTNA